MASESHTTLSLGTDYRSARRLNSVICTLGLGWSAAQFELSSANFGGWGAIDISDGSIPLILACAISYLTAKTFFGFAMQPKAVRRWSLAQIDFKLCWFLVRATLLMLAASGLHRSVDTFVIVVLGALALLLGSMLLIFLGTGVLTPIFECIRQSSSSASPAASVFKALAWSELIVTVLVVLLIAALGIVSLNWQPLLRLWTEPPDPVAVGIFVTTAIAVVVSLKFDFVWQRKLFAKRMPTVKKRPDGTIEVSIPSSNEADKE